MAYTIKLKKYGRTMRDYAVKSKKEAQKTQAQLEAQGIKAEIIKIKLGKRRLSRVM